MSTTLDATVAKRLDISVKQNQTFDAVIEFTDNAGTPIDLTSAQAKMSIRQHGCQTACACAGDSDFNQVFKQDLVPEITGVDHNKLSFFDTILLAEGHYKYDLLVEYISGKKQYVLVGSFKVKRSYTNI